VCGFRFGLRRECRVRQEVVCVCVCVCVCVVQKSLEILGFRAEEVAFVCCSREFGDFWVSWCMCEVWRDDVTET